MRFTYQYTSRYTEGDLIELLREFETKIGRPPRMEDVDKDEKMPNSSTFATHFGTWNKALDAAGLQRLQWKYNDDELLDRFISLHERLGRIPKKTEMENAKTYPAVRSFTSRFGSWEKAVELALYRKFAKEQEVVA